MIRIRMQLCSHGSYVPNISNLVTEQSNPLKTATISLCLCNHRGVISKTLICLAHSCMTCMCFSFWKGLAVADGLVAWGDHRAISVLGDSHGCCQFSFWDRQCSGDLGHIRRREFPLHFGDVKVVTSKIDVRGRKNCLKIKMIDGVVPIELILKGNWWYWLEYTVVHNF